jgi:hypothetical protein
MGSNDQRYCVLKLQRHRHCNNILEGKWAEVADGTMIRASGGKSNPDRWDSPALY